MFMEERHAQIAEKIKTDGKIRYTVPQIITKIKDVTVYFRVSDVFKNVKICVYDGERMIFSKKKPKVAPGEMESVKLTGDVLRSCSALIFKLEEE